MEDQYAGTFEIDTETGLMFVPEGEGTKLDYEKVNSFSIEVTVRDRCQNNGCYFGKLAENYFVNISAYWQKLIFNAPINPLPANVEYMVSSE